MDNVFIVDLFPWNRPSRKVVLANRLLGALGFKPRLVPAVDPWIDMTSPEQRLNIYHTVSQILRYDVPGDLVELGCYTGETAAMIQKINIGEGRPPRALHVYDSFETQFAATRPPREVLEENFTTRGLPLPTIHEGRFEKTVPDALPERIAVAHIDCGTGGDADSHAALVEFLLEHVYPRIPKGGAILLMDYIRPAVWQSWQGNPGVAQAADRFFADKPEEIDLLYAGEMSQGVVFKR